MELNTSLSSGQAKFVVWLEQELPHLLPLFDFNQRMLLTSKLESYLACASHGEQIMARFVATVWTHENEFNFNIIEAASILDERHITIITNWLKQPIWA